MDNNDGEPIPAAPKESWYAFPPEETNFAECIETEPNNNPGWCLLCWYSQSNKETSVMPHIRMLLRYVEENWEKVDPKVLTLAVQQFYNKEIRQLLPDST